MTTRSSKVLAALFVSLFVGVVAACGSSASAAPPAPVLDGAYAGASGGPYVWAAFHGDAYALWKSDADCNRKATTAPSSCAEKGTFTYDAATEILTLEDAQSGASRTLLLTDVTTEAATTTQSVRPLGVEDGTGTPLEQGGTSLVVPDHVTQFAAVPQGGSGSRLAPWKVLVFGACQLIAVALTPGEADSLPDVQLPAPPPISSIACPPKKTG